MMLVGRDEEILALGGLFRDCARGKGAVAVIRGPVAVGKTMLLRAFADQAVADGAVFLSAVASQAERGLPLGVVDQLCRGSDLPDVLAGQVAELMDGHDRGTFLDQPAVSPALAQLFDGLLKLLVELSEGCPVVIAVEDVQHADVASLQFLSYLARRAGASRILTVLTECAHALPADRLVRAEILRQGNCRCIPLAPLSSSGVTKLLGKYFDLAAARRLTPACQALTGGNPLLVHALAEDSRAAANGSPAADDSPAAGGSPAALVPGAAFCSAVVDCLHRHEPALVELAQAVAVFGADARLGLLGELLAVNPESAARGLDALTASGLLEAAHFRNEQARQAVLGHMTADERAAMHANAARVLYQAGAASVTLARHLVAAHRTGARWAAAALQEAAEHALAEGRTDRAIDYLRRAKSQCADERQRATIMLSLTSAEWPIDPERAARHLPELVADARVGLLDRDRLSELAYYLLWAGDTPRAAEILTSLGAASGHPVTESPVDVLYPEMARRSRQAVQEAKTSVQPTPRMRPQREAAVRAGRQREAAAYARPEPAGPPLVAAERILAERSLNDPTLASITTALMALIGEDMLDRAESWCQVLLREFRAPGGSGFWRAMLTAFMAMVDVRRGNLPAAEDQARAALSLLSNKAWGVAIGGPLASLLLAATANRKHEVAAAYLRTPVPEAMFGTVYGLLYLHARGEYYLSTGRPQAALDDFADCGDRMDTWELDLPGLVPWRAKAAEAHLVMGDTLKAREFSEEQLAQAGARFARTRGIALRSLALASDPGKRAALLRESAEVLRDSGARLELAYTFTELSNAYLMLGENSRAHWAARQARNLAERCGAPTPNTTLGIADIGHQSGDGVAAKLLTQLTDAEQRVAMLAVYGYTNGQIASKLFITVSTVEQHLTRIYRKLGVAGRAELPIGI